jgi:hypothetical protein
MTHQQDAVGATRTSINAVLDAPRPLGVTDITIPSTPVRVWRAISSLRAGTLARCLQRALWWA